MIYNDENGIHFIFIYIYTLNSHDNVIAKAITLLISVAVARTGIFQKKDHNDIHHKDNDTNIKFTKHHSSNNKNYDYTDYTQ